MSALPFPFAPWIGGFDASESPPVASIDTCLVYADMLSADGTPDVGKVGLLIIEHRQRIAGAWLGISVSDATSVEVTDGDGVTVGRMSWTVARGAEVLVVIRQCGVRKVITVPDAASFEVEI